MDALNDILAAVAIGLFRLYPEVKTYSENVPNELPDKCFIIGFAGEPKIEKFINNRFKFSGKLDISYLSNNNELSINSEYNHVFYNLSLNLQVISYENFTVRLNSHTIRTVDNVMHDICSFETFIVAHDETPEIKQITVRKE